MHKPKLQFSALTVTLAYIAMSAVVLILFSIPIVYAWHEIVEKRNIERLEEDAQRLSGLYAEHGQLVLSDLISAGRKPEATGDEKFILLADHDFHLIRGNVPAWPQRLAGTPGTYHTTFQFNGQKVCAIFVTTELPDHHFLAVGRNTSNYELVETLFWSGLSGAIGIIVMFGILGRWMIRSMLLSEIGRISHATAEIIGGDLTRRLPRNSSESELDLLAETVNRILDQIQQLIHANRHVSDSIAHDLRTPLAELRFRLEALTLSDNPVEQVYTEIDAAIIDVDRVIMVFNALLRLAEIDHGARRAGFEQVDVVKMVDDVVDFYRPLAELKGIALNFVAHEAISTAGDALLLAQAVGNLIDNALKYTQSMVRVEINYLKDAGRILIDVSDDGMGISDADKPRVVERFYRGDTSRGTDGVGLGLSLVAAVARLHGGALELADGNPGLHAILIIHHRDQPQF